MLNIFFREALPYTVRWRSSCRDSVRGCIDAGPSVRWDWFSVLQPLQRASLLDVYVFRFLEQYGQSLELQENSLQVSVCVSRNLL